jgi:uncharacterized protein YcaQ
VRTLTREEARRVAVRAAGLAGGSSSVLEVAESLGDLQLDPTSAVARSHLLVLWSRLGPYDRRELDGLLWKDRSLFEYRAFILPARDAAIHAASMRTYLLGDPTGAERGVCRLVATFSRRTGRPVCRGTGASRVPCRR